ncbi:MAG: phosphatidylglycerophosphatase A family protein [Anaplasma sp.]
MLRYSEVVSTWFFCGKAPRAPGTVGSVAALAFFPVVAFNAPAALLLSAGVFVLGLRAVAIYLASHPEGNQADPREVVIDEVCGQMLVFAIAATLEWYGCIHLPKDGLSRVILLCSGFLSFRMFDIAKPWPISVVDARIKGALGVMLDDVVAAIPASAVSLAVVNAGFA